LVFQHFADGGFIQDAVRLRACGSYCRAFAGVQAAELDTGFVGGQRHCAAERGEEAGITLRLPPLRFCTDNGAQIAALGSAAVRAGVAPSPMDFAPDSGMPLDVSVAH